MKTGKTGRLLIYLFAIVLSSGCMGDGNGRRRIR